MAKQRKNALMAGTSGKIGNVVFRQMYGETVITARPTKGPRSESQILQARRMTAANRYAAIMIADPAIEKEYRSGIKENLPNAFRVAVADYMNSPVVHQIRIDDYTWLPGASIKIKATDDFKVMRVGVEILDGHGEVIEKGEAVRYFNRPNFWKYRITSINKQLKETRIRATAFDRPNNKGFLEVVL
jgi:hypothetical protein